jgi:large subunit ribosomal protein L44e
MKFNKTTKRYCPKCKKHTEQKVAQAKKRQNVHPLGKSAKKRRNFGKGYGSLGTRGSKPAGSKFKMWNKKMTKNVDLRYTCNECSKTSVKKQGFRARKVEFQ